MKSTSRARAETKGLRSQKLRQELRSQVAQAAEKNREDLYRILKAIDAHPDHLLPRWQERSSPRKFAERWVAKYCRARESASRKKPRKRRPTVSDPAVKLLVRKALRRAGAKLDDGHRLYMSAENLIGKLLEEFIEKRIAQRGWTYCWGSVVRNVDFIGPRNVLLQVKNKSNSENAPASSVRDGKAILKWHRLGAYDGKTHWGELKNLTGGTGLTEGKFHKYCIEAFNANPSRLHVPRGLRANKK